METIANKITEGEIGNVNNIQSDGIYYQLSDKQKYTDAQKSVVDKLMKEST